MLFASIFVNRKFAGQTGRTKLNSKFWILSNKFWMSIVMAVSFLQEDHWTKSCLLELDFEEKYKMRHNAVNIVEA